MIGDLPQSKRLAILNKFKAGEIKILVATDVAARGIDVDDLAMVINYDLPVEAENYVHRIGRTARAGKSGKAYTFCSEQDVYNLPAIERYIEMQIPATVAYPDQMEEDKSAGMYIKTENWRGDDDYDNRGGYRKGRDGDIHNRRRDDRGDRHGRHEKSYIDPEKLAGLSYEERMKMYKETYAANGSSKAGYNKDYKKSGYKNNSYNKSGNYKKGDYKKGDYKKKPYSQQNKPAAEQKKTFWQKVKSFFGR